MLGAVGDETLTIEREEQMLDLASWAAADLVRVVVVAAGAVRDGEPFTVWRERELAERLVAFGERDGLTRYAERK